MDLTVGLIVSVLVGPVVLQVLHALLWFLSNVVVPLFVHRIDVAGDRTNIDKIDHLLIKHGYVSRVVPDIAGTIPSHGLHAMWLNGPVLLYKTSYETDSRMSIINYDVYMLRCTASYTRWMQFSSIDGVCRITMMSLDQDKFNTHREGVRLDRRPATVEQAAAAATITDLYRRDGRASMLVHGPSGSGKSDLALYVANAVGGTVLRGFDPKTKCVSIMRVINWFCPSLSSPLILVINEFDSAIKMAELGAESRTDRSCHAQTPTALLDMLDFLESVPGLIVIATMNTNPGDDKKMYRYTRPGRFDCIKPFFEELCLSK